MRTAFLVALLASACATPAFANDIAVDDRGVTVEQGPIKLNLGGRVHIDAAAFDEPPPAVGRALEVDFRRVRVELSGEIGDVIRFRVDREFAGNAKGWRNVWLGISPAKNVEVRGGNLMSPFSAEDLQSSNSIPFAERSLASTLAPGYGLGGQLGINGKRWSLTAGWFTDALDNEDGRSAERGRGFVGRATILPVSAGKTRLHLGAAFETRSFDTGEVLRFSADSGSVLAPTAMSSGAVTDARKLNGWNVEVGFANGPLLVRGHATGLVITRNLSPDLHFNGQTIQVSWLVLGGRYDYARSVGIFSGPDLKRGKSAIELGLRYSRLDLSDGIFDRGVGEAVTGGANWYLGRNLRIMLDLTRTKVTFANPALDHSSTVGVARFQINF